ncbi:unnamed protein product [Blepharisma stoltei]|uniref:Reverse transcriptase n=1 Tax=Blepharisma stoltei TaxID=1481888 RepID=A0AAU9J342_9CILI|nr:unnamed protein product [Blepharisma stoltei]
MMVNPDRRTAIGSIHRLRAGFNFCNANAHLRHLIASEKCENCDEAETEEHVISKCPRYNDQRKQLVEKLVELRVDIERIGLMEIALYGKEWNRWCRKAKAESERKLTLRSSFSTKGFWLTERKASGWRATWLKRCAGK